MASREMIRAAVRRVEAAVLQLMANYGQCDAREKSQSAGELVMERR
jgi:hypothetical protein